jgi:hypothetical protein
LPDTSKLTLDLSAASTTPENFRIRPEAISDTVMVLIARTASIGGGGSGPQAHSEKINKKSSKIRAQCVGYGDGIL